MNELQALYNELYKAGYYTKSFDEFVSQYSDDEYKKKVYDLVSEEGLYTKDYNSFTTKYASVQPDQSVKKKEEPQGKAMDSKPSDGGLVQEDVDEEAYERDYLDIINNSLVGIPMAQMGTKILSTFTDADYQNAWDTGVAQGFTPAELTATLFSDKIKTKEDAARVVNAANELEKVGPSKSYKEFQRITSKYEKDGYDGFSSTLMGLAEKPEVATEVIMQSLIAVGPAIATNPVDMLKAIGSGAAAGFVAGGLQGAIGGAAFGGRFGLNMLLDSSLSSIEFLKEELGDKDFTPENVLEVLNNKEKYDRIVSRSTRRGATIGTVEGILGKFAGGLASKTKLGAAALEVVSGGLGELGAQVAAEQEINPQEIILESVGGIVGLPGVLAESKVKKYTVNGEQTTKAKAEAVVNNLTSEELKDVDIKSNDEEFINKAKEKKKQDETAKPAEGNRLFSEPLQDATTIAERFAERTGRTIEPVERITEIDQEKAKSIGEAYEKMESNPTDPEVQRAYEAMINETVEQYKDIVESGYQVEINDQEPYRSSTEMIEDLRNNKNMKIFSTESGFGKEGITEEQRASNPLLKDSGFTDKNGKKLLMNDVFRFVHDYFGHAKLGNSFGPIGEENAWRVHSAMYSPLARRAMTSETRGQNSWVNFSGVNDEAFKLRDEAREIRKKAEQLPEDSPERKKMLTDAFEKVQQVYEKMRFADQKIGLLPDEMIEFTQEELSAIQPEKKPSEGRVQSIIDGIIKKTEARLTPDVAPKKKLSNVLSYLQENSKLYEELNDSQREKMVIDLTKKLGIPVESSPQIRTVLGIKKETPVTIKVKPFEEFKKRLRELEKVSKEAVKFTKKQQTERKKAIVDLVKELRKKGRLTSAQQLVILNRATNAVINEKNFSPVLDYIKKVYDNAELAEKIAAINKLQKNTFGKKNKKNIQTKLGVAPHLYPQLERIAKMDTKFVDLNKIDDMFDILSVVGERRKVLDLASLKEMAGKIENILSGEEIISGLSPEQVQRIEKAEAFLKMDFDSITEEEFEALPDAMKRNINRTRSNVEAEFMTPDAIDVIKEVKSKRASEVVLEKINPNKFLDMISLNNRVKSMLSGRGLTLEKIRSNSTRYIDDVLGNFKGSEIYQNTFETIAKSYSNLQADLEIFNAKKQEALQLIFGKNLIKSSNEGLKSSIKMKLTALQLENEFNQNDKSTAPALDWIDSVIDHYKKGDAKEHEIRFMENVKEEFLGDKNNSAEQLYNKLTPQEKKAYKIIQEANSELVDKMLIASATVRGQRPKTYNAYTYHDVLYSENEYKSIVENKFQTLVSTKPSTKAGTIMDRQPGVRPINLDIFSSSESGARQTLTDYHMTMPVRTLYSAIQKMQGVEDLSDSKRKSVNAIAKAVDEALRGVFERDHVRQNVFDTFIDFMSKVGYRAALASVPRAASETIGNMGHIMFVAPKDFIRGASDIKEFTKLNGLDILNSVSSVHTSRLYGAQDQTTAFSGKTAFNRVDKNPGRAKSEIYDKAEFILKNSTGRLSKLTSYVSDTLIQAGDKPLARILWFGSFKNKFKQITGVEVDFDKISSKDLEYFKKYKGAIDDSTSYADENISKSITSLNPFDTILKLQEKEGKSSIFKILNRANSFMARFTINEYMQARQAIHSLIFDGKLTTKQSTAILTGITARMSTYMVLYSILKEQMKELLGLEEKEEPSEEMLYRQLVGSILTLLSRGTAGNLPMIPINYGLEVLNEKYFDALRGYRDYDPYKHSIVFSQITDEKLRRGELAETAIEVTAGPYVYPYKAAERLYDSYTLSKYSKRGSTRKKYEDKIKMVHAIDALGMTNLLPFYKDIRTIAQAKYFEKYPYRKK